MNIKTNEETFIINGKEKAKEIKATIAKEIECIKNTLSSKELNLNEDEKSFLLPHLTVIQVGDNSASSTYVRNKEKACEEVEIYSEIIKLEETITEKILLELIEELNNDNEVDGVLVQLPLPSHIDTNKVIETISHTKDVDGFSSYNLGLLVQNKAVLKPCTPYGVMELLNDNCNGTDLKGKKAVVVGASNIVGKLVALELLNAGCTVTVCNSKTPDETLKQETLNADIVIVAIGKAEFINQSYINPDRKTIVIDVGINYKDGKLVGDVKRDVVCYKKTPVPNGVGPMTVAMLMKNTLEAYKMNEFKQNKIR